MPQTTETGEILPTVPAEQFFAVDIRSAVITAVEEFPEARQPAYRLRLDLGLLGERVSSAQITSYEPRDLIGTTVVCVVNLPPRRIAGFKSEVLVLGVYDPDGTVILLRPDRPVPPGHRVG
jgi:tRNA-binding protein